MSTSPHIFDVTEATFDRYVLENSFHKPVLVDFWAEWCAPCKALMPVLAAITDSYAGELLMAKVDCDQQPGLSERFGIRSLPTVVLFKDGQPVDGFAGIQPESAIRAILEPHLGPVPEMIEDSGDDLAVVAAGLLEQGDAAQAIALLQPAISEQPDDGLLLLLGRALAMDGQFDAAEQVLEAVKNRETNKTALAGAKTHIAFLRQAVGMPARDVLEQRIQQDAGDSEATYQLAVVDLAEQRYGEALAALLSLFQRDRGYADGTPHRTLLEVFNVLGSEHPLTIEYRRKLYQALY